MSLLLSLALTSACQSFSAQCVCYPAVPFEGFQVYVYEKCDQQEGSFKYGESVYDSVEQCQAVIDNDKNCQGL